MRQKQLGALGMTVRVELHSRASWAASLVFSSCNKVLQRLWKGDATHDARSDAHVLSIDWYSMSTWLLVQEDHCNSDDSSDSLHHMVSCALIISTLLRFFSRLLQTNERGQVTVKSSVLKQMEDLKEETGLTCVICREGYRYQPAKVRATAARHPALMCRGGFCPEPLELLRKQKDFWEPVPARGIQPVTCQSSAIDVRKRNGVPLPN